MSETDLSEAKLNNGADDIRERNIGEFTICDNPMANQEAMERLLRDLNTAPLSNQGA